MNPVALLLAIVESVIGVGGFACLILNCSGDCDPMTNVLCTVCFMVFSVLAAGSWMKSFASKAAQN